MKPPRLPTYSNYRLLPDDDRQAMYEQWCVWHACDPLEEASGEAFVASIPDQVTEHSQLTPQQQARRDRTPWRSIR